MKKALKNFYLGSFSLATFVAGPAYAADTASPTIKVPSNGPSIESILSGVTSILFWVAGIAAVIVIIVSGIMFVVSGGDENTTKKARNALLYAIIGLVVVVLSASIVQFVLGRL